MRRKNRPRSPNASNDGTDNVHQELWLFKDIIDDKIENGYVKYKLSWFDSALMRDDIFMHPNGKRYALCRGREFNITDAVACDPSKEGRLRSSVGWADTWHDAEDLKGCEDHIADYEARKRSVQERDSHTLSTPNSTDVAMRQPGFTAINVQQSSDLIRRPFIPKPGVNYSHPFRTYIKNIEGEPNNLMTALIKATPVRSLTVCEEFSEKARVFHLTENAKARSFLAYDSGYEQQVPCDVCKDGTGPFELCVVSFLGAGMSGGACMNCTYQRKNTSCNYHMSRSCLST